ncbi:MAG: purine-nucleoside phosphorylase [Desulfoprunum sp.]|jgi:purine-nucleoside phosphorylase|uniref:purine-nucleoside phosphorylase n=1 Tax=Desulfoprunum sp. TaxID=2020866 RepID=UPI00052C0A01|nr:purine nucleoside phosphorylase [Desulfobulbus sp. Tol-SR]
MDHGRYVQAVQECEAFCRSRLPYLPETVVQSGTGLGGFADRIDAELTIPYRDIPHFPRATVAGHPGNLIIGRLADRPVAVLQGRFHYYEGYSTPEVAFPIRVLSLLGARTLILTNAAGGLNPLFEAGSIMVVRDHLNFLGENPLRGPNVDAWGPRFPDLSQPYHPGLIQAALDCAVACGLENVITGTYACIPGPSLETPAETRWLRDSGADAVGMSSVPEVIVARHAGMAVLGLSAISNINDPDNFHPILLDDILECAGRIGPQIATLIGAVLAGEASSC